MLASAIRCHRALRHCYCRQRALAARLFGPTRSWVESSRKRYMPISAMQISYLSQKEAISVDEELMGPLGFSVDQLMELAGLSVACAIASEYSLDRSRKVLVLAGPGNNGGDGLVAGRHLHHFGYDVKVCYPKRTDKPLYHQLVTQCEALGLAFLPLEEVLSLRGPVLKEKYDLVIDALFGFSFKGEPRAPFRELLQMLHPSQSPPPVISVDIPSGWDVERGDISGDGLKPDMLVSLTAPKVAARHFQGRFHYLGGRFVPPAIREKYHLVLPPYPSTAQCVRLEALPAAPASQQAPELPAVSDMRISYERGGLEEKDMDPDPMQQFDSWFKDAVQMKVCEEPNAITLATVSLTSSPSARPVLLKGYDDRGFVFYTNYNSRKGQDLSSTGCAAFSMYWEKLQRCVRVEGRVERVPEVESEEYFQSRPRGSQVGAWVSHQSQEVSGGREEIEKRARDLAKVYEDSSIPVPRPPHWGGFLIKPVRIEFWQGRPSRLHDRLVYTLADEGQGCKWKMARLYP